jgi:hypothetical protein
LSNGEALLTPIIPPHFHTESPSASATAREIGRYCPHLEQICHVEVITGPVNMAEGTAHSSSIRYDGCGGVKVELVPLNTMKA